MKDDARETGPSAEGTQEAHHRKVRDCSKERGDVPVDTPFSIGSHWDQGTATNGRRQGRQC